MISSYPRGKTAEKVAIIALLDKNRPKTGQSISAGSLIVRRRFTPWSVRAPVLPIMENLLSRRVVLGGLLGGAATVALGGPAGATRGPRVLVATNEPWGTYHVKPLLAEAARRGWRLTQLVPDYTGITPGDPVPVATPGDAPPADLLVVTGTADWPADCVARFPRLPLVASSLSYQKPVEAPRAKEIRPRRVTSSSAAEGRAFATYLGTHKNIRIVGSPQTDGLPPRAPEPDLVLVLTSVTHPDSTGGAAPGTELLLAATEKLAAAGKRILVGPHPGRTARSGTGTRSARWAPSRRRPAPR